MDHATQVELARRILELKTAGVSQLDPAPVANPVSDYTSPEQLGLELEHLFRRGALLAGLSCDAPAPGDWFTLEVAGTPILVVRDADGTLRAFLNVCRHRGARVADGSGRDARRFTCPYHAWTYDCAGRLVSPSHREGFAGIDPNARGLRELAVAEGHGLVYVRQTPGEAIDLRAELAGIERELAPFDFARYHRVEARTATRAMNWKLVVDTFLEQYHVPYLHRSTIAPMFLRDLCLHDPFGRNGRMAAVRRSIEELEGKPESAWTLLPHTTLLFQLFPNTVLIYQQDHVQLWQVFPAGSPDRATMRVTQYAPEAPASEKATRHWKTNMDLLMDVTNDEDFVQSERMQQGFHTPAQEAVLFGRNEPGLIHYHRMIRAAIGLGA